MVLKTKCTEVFAENVYILLLVVPTLFILTIFSKHFNFFFLCIYYALFEQCNLISIHAFTFRKCQGFCC